MMIPVDTLWPDDDDPRKPRLICEKHDWFTSDEEQEPCAKCRVAELEAAIQEVDKIIGEAVCLITDGEERLRLSRWWTHTKARARSNGVYRTSGYRGAPGAPRRLRMRDRVSR